jgi:hypothetical protein
MELVARFVVGLLTTIRVDRTFGYTSATAM